MSLYYIHINTDRLSLELDSDINYYLDFKPGDILTIESNANKFMICELNGERIGYYKNNLKLDYELKILNIQPGKVSLFGINLMII